MNEVLAVQKLVPLPKQKGPKTQISYVKRYILETFSNWSIRSVDGKPHKLTKCFRRLGAARPSAKSKFLVEFTS